MRVGLPGLKEQFFLPKGTTLYYETSYSEGVQIYKIYVQIVGPNLPLVEEKNKNSITPLYGANPLMEDDKDK